MAILNTPLIHPIYAFDPQYNYSVSFTYTGNQTVRNRAVVLDNDTYQTVYDSVQDRMRPDHVFPGGTFSPGKSYQIRIKVFDAYGNESPFSEPVLFCCYSTPEFRFDALDKNTILHTANPKLTLIYSQKEQEALQDFQFLLYDYDKTLLTSSEHKYDASDMTHIFYGLKNESEYYVRATGTTVHGLRIETDYIKISIKYFLMPANVLFEAKNHPENGSIALESGVIDIGYEIENDNYTIKNSELIIGSDNTLTYNAGFEITDEFKVFLKARKVPLDASFFKMRCPGTGKYLDIRIKRLGKAYYGILNIPYGAKLGHYNIFAEIPTPSLADAQGSLLVDTAGNLLMLAAPGYPDQNTAVFEISYKNGRYDLSIYYENDSTVENI